MRTQVHVQVLYSGTLVVFRRIIQRCLLYRTMLPIIQDIANKLGQMPTVESVVLFGSRARGDHRERSDIDLAVLCPDASSRDWFAMTDIVDEARTLLKIDLVRYDRMEQEFRDEIDLEGVVLYEREEENQAIPT